MYRFAQAFAVLGVSMWLISWLSKRKGEQGKSYPASLTGPDSTVDGMM
jgi:hypothetical protein